MTNGNKNKSKSFFNIIGKSAPMERVFSMINKVGDTNSTVLVYGESGTGKELVARALHNTSSRKNNLLVSINCGAIPEGLLESELFGHEKGAFTGAMKTRIGKFELANKSTIFLDEIAEMSPNLQVKILRVLQENEIERVGGTSTIKIDVRVIAATNKDLEKSIEEKVFREDLYYRLNVIPINISPLRERKEDIPLLIDNFIDYYNKTKEKNIVGVSSEAMDILLSYNWPGNVRELKNIIERMVILKDNGEMIFDDIPEKILFKTGQKKNTNHSDGIKTSFSNLLQNSQGYPDIYLSDDGVDLKNIVRNFEKDLIIKALKKSNSIKKNAAKLLGLNRTTLVEKIKKMGIEKEKI